LINSLLFKNFESLCSLQRKIIRKQEIFCWNILRLFSSSPLWLRFYWIIFFLLQSCSVSIINLKWMSNIFLLEWISNFLSWKDLNFLLNCIIFSWFLKTKESVWEKVSRHHSNDFWEAKYSSIWRLVIFLNITLSKLKLSRLEFIRSPKYKWIQMRDITWKRLRHLININLKHDCQSTPNSIFFDHWHSYYKIIIVDESCHPSLISYLNEIQPKYWCSSQHKRHFVLRSARGFHRIRKDILEV
jgi:hypothetical protein